MVEFQAIVGVQELEVSRSSSLLLRITIEHEIVLPPCKSRSYRLPNILRTHPLRFQRRIPRFDGNSLRKLHPRRQWRIHHELTTFLPNPPEVVTKSHMKSHTSVRASKGLHSGVPLCDGFLLDIP